MKNHLIVAFTLCITINSFAQKNYWQQRVNYTIDVTLNDDVHSLTGFERIEYTNNSPDTLSFIWFHVWPNAYKNDKTAFSEQQLEHGLTKFYFASQEDRGYINRMDFKVNNVTAEVEDHPEHIDIIKLKLPSPLAPGRTITITTPFHVKFPAHFSRMGHFGQSYQVTQWYPKPAVYDKNGWHPMPYLDQGEFYSEFGSFDVRITVPANYAVAATGELQNSSEKEWLLKRSDFEWSVPTKLNLNGNAKAKAEDFPASASETKTLQYKQNNVHDFAWFADKRFIVKHDTCQLASGRVIDVYTFFTPQLKETWKNSIQYSKDAIHHYSKYVGEYPYNIVSVVQGYEGLVGGMEYPTITVITPIKDPFILDNIIAHEIGHNWFYGILGTNERQHPWLDEGINSYYDDSYLLAKYKRGPQEERLLFEIKTATHTDQPIEGRAEKFSTLNYFGSVYYKTAEWLRYVESRIGTDTFHRAMQEYYKRWQFKHPQPEDFKQVLRDVSGRDLNEEFAMLYSKGDLPTQKKEGTRVGFIFNSKLLQSQVRNPAKNMVLIGPLLGFNSYDKLQLGAFITNIKLPPSRFQFLAVPLFATGSTRLNGIGYLNYKFFPEKLFRKIEVGVTGSTFSMNRYENELGEKTYLAFRKVVPNIRFTFKQKNPRRRLNRFIEFKSFIIGEDAFRFSRDSVFSGTPPDLDTQLVTRARTVKDSRVLNQLLVVWENSRSLYPYRSEWKVEQGKHFVRLAFTGKYFFNYSKEGGLDLRIFAGKFFYTGTKTLTKQFETQRYHLNMTGPNGYEDYNYADYFLGRNIFEGLASQQMMVRDGGFKVRTDLLADEVGLTDNWLLSANFSSTIPSGLNPLSLLPIKIPLKVFFDIGTYAETWKQKEETDRFLYDAGLQLSLFRENVHIYLPILYSRVYKDYIQSTIAKKGRLLKTISFAIDISNFDIRKFDRLLEF